MSLTPERQRLVLEAVKALLLHGPDVITIVAGGPAQFVQTARPFYKANDVAFSDAELRLIFHGLTLAAQWQTARAQRA